MIDKRESCYKWKGKRKNYTNRISTIKKKKINASASVFFFFKWKVQW